MQPAIQGAQGSITSMAGTGAELRFTAQKAAELLRLYGQSIIWEEGDEAAQVTAISFHGGRRGLAGAQCRQETINSIGTTEYVRPSGVSERPSAR